MIARWTPLAILLPLAACDLDPQAAAARDYHDAMMPLLVENADISRDFLDLAAQIKKEDTSAKAIARVMRKTTIPAAEHLRQEVEDVHPDSAALQEAHAELVTAWTDRLTAYQDLHAAWKSQDLEAFDRAADENLRAAGHEEHYFTLVNQALAPYELSLPPFPTAPAPK